MKIKFLEDTHVRLDIQTPAIRPIGMVYRGCIIEVEDQVFKGFVVERIDQWYRDRNGWYYWAGSTEVVSREHFAIAVQQDGGVGVRKSATAAPPASEPRRESAAREEDAPKAVQDSTRVSAAAEKQAVSVKKPPVFEKKSAVPAKKAAPAAPPKKSVSSELESFSTQISPPETPAEAAGSSAEAATANAGFSFQMPFGQTTAEPQPTPATLAAAPKTEGKKLSWGIENYQISTEWWKVRGLTGRGVNIALLGTGIAPGNPDLQNSVQDWASVFGSEPMNDSHGLGTQAAVVAAGRGALAYGVAPEARLLVGKIGMLDHDCTPDALLAGLEWAIASNAQVVAALVDLRELSAAERTAFELFTRQALDKNILLLAPVGNSVERRPEERFPAALEGWISVGACDAFGKRSAFSAKSYHLDLLAPGEGLLTSNAQNQAVTNTKNTAIATAFLAGLLALARQFYFEKNRPLDVAALLRLLRETATPNKVITKGDDIEYGYGILNPIEFLKGLEGG